MLTAPEFSRILGADRGGPPYQDRGGMVRGACVNGFVGKHGPDWFLHLTFSHVIMPTPMTRKPESKRQLIARFSHTNCFILCSHSLHSCSLTSSVDRTQTCKSGGMEHVW